jgi:hypothetical protein
MRSCCEKEEEDSRAHRMAELKLFKAIFNKFFWVRLRKEDANSKSASRSQDGLTTRSELKLFKAIFNIFFGSD